MHAKWLSCWLPGLLSPVSSQSGADAVVPMHARPPRFASPGHCTSGVGISSGSGRNPNVLWRACRRADVSNIVITPTVTPCSTHCHDDTRMHSDTFISPRVLLYPHSPWIAVAPITSPSCLLGAPAAVCISHLPHRSIATPPAHVGAARSCWRLAMRCDAVCRKCVRSRGSRRTATCWNSGSSGPCGGCLKPRRSTDLTHTQKISCGR